MSDIPPYRPDPTRDTTRDATGDASTAQPWDPADLPSDASAPEGETAYDTTFGLGQSTPSSWVPQRAGDPAQPAQSAPPAAPSPFPVSDRLRTVTLPAAASRSLGGRLQTWHVAAIVVGVLVPVGIGFWAASGLADDPDPVARPAVSVTRHRPTPSRTIALPTIITTVPGQGRPLPGAGTTPTTSTRTWPGTTTPPQVVTVPAIPVTPVPANARTIRFETYAEKGARIEVSLSDAAHHRYDYPAQAAPLAFETPVDPGATNNDYYSLRVRISDPTGSGVTGAVSCRIVVDGVVVTAQQGQDYATCSISPYFDIRRR